MRRLARPAHDCRTRSNPGFTAARALERRRSDRDAPGVCPEPEESVRQQRSQAAGVVCSSTATSLGQRPRPGRTAQWRPDVPSSAVLLAPSQTCDTVPALSPLSAHSPAIESRVYPTLPAVIFPRPRPALPVTFTNPHSCTSPCLFCSWSPPLAFLCPTYLTKPLPAAGLERLSSPHASLGCRPPASAPSS